MDSEARESKVDEVQQEWLEAEERLYFSWKLTSDRRMMFLQSNE